MLTVEAAAAPDRLIDERSHLQSVLDQITANPNPADQYWLLEGLRIDALQDPNTSIALIDLAADPASSSSLFVRAYALEMGLGAISAAARNPQSTWHPITAAQQALYQQAYKLIPEYFDGTSEPLTYNAEQGFGSGAYDRYCRLMAEREGIDKALLYPDRFTVGIRPELEEDNLPIAVCMLAQRLMQTEYYQDIGALSPTLMVDTWQAALDFRGQEYQAAVSTEPSRLGVFAGVARLTGRGGREHNALVESLYTSLDEDVAFRYARTFNGLYKAIEGLQDAFPREFGPGVIEGARALLANALFAVTEHEKNGRSTDTKIGLLSGYELPVRFEGDEPLELLQGLEAALHSLRHVVTSKEIRPVLAIDGVDFKVHRFGTDVSCYNRPLGDHVYNYDYEYGRPREGVEASIGYTIRLPGQGKGRLLPLRKDEKNGYEISIRLDREGRSASREGQRDPMRSEGVVALDIGSVLGDPDSFGTKVGRLLALGNMYRSNIIGTPAGLNHVTDWIDQTYGSADQFAGAALRFDRETGRSQVVGKHNLGRYCGRASLSRAAAVTS